MEFPETRDIRRYCNSFKLTLDPRLSDNYSNFVELDSANTTPVRVSRSLYHSKELAASSSRNLFVPRWRSTRLSQKLSSFIGISLESIETNAKGDFRNIVWKVSNIWNELAAEQNRNSDGKHGKDANGSR